MLKLDGTDGEKFYSWELKPGSYSIGRGADADFQVPDKTVSRIHARIDVDESGQCFIEDLDSHNGTAVNGVRIDSKKRIKAEDALVLGRAEFKLSTGAESPFSSSGSPRTPLAEEIPEHSVFMSVDETKRPLPRKASEIPELLPTLFDIARMLAQTDPKQEMLDKSLKLISRIIPAERLVILNIDDKTGDVYTAARLVLGKNEPGELQLSKTIINEIMENRASVLIGNPMDDPRFSDQKSIIMSEMNSAMAVPLFEEERVLGILYVDTTQPLHRYNDDYLRVLATFGNIIASRLINYNLMEERQVREVLNAELRRASKIQRDLLVTDIPNIEGYKLHFFQEQSRSVGGDLYDLQKISDRRMLLLVADVSGKGLGAALLMSNILASFRIQYHNPDFDLARAVESVSLQLCNYSKSENFATLFAAILDFETNSINYVNAGHNPPLFINADGDLDYLEATGMMIGAFDFATWEEKSIKLSPSDLVLIFTDGVTEADNGNVEQQYGDDRLEQLAVSARALAPEELNQKILDDVDAFVGDAPRSDDITTMILKRE